MERLFRYFSVLLIFICLVLLLLPIGASEGAVASTEGDRITRFLILGCDQSTRLTDSILIVSINESTKQAKILQIPRDTYAEYTEKDYKKLNGAMNTLGERGVKTFLSEALGVPID